MIRFMVIAVVLSPSMIARAEPCDWDRPGFARNDPPSKRAQVIHVDASGSEPRRARSITPKLGDRHVLAMHQTRRMESVSDKTTVRMGFPSIDRTWRYEVKLIGSPDQGMLFEFTTGVVTAKGQASVTLDPKPPRPAQSGEAERMTQLHIDNENAIANRALLYGVSTRGTIVPADPKQTQDAILHMFVALPVEAIGKGARWTLDAGVTAGPIISEIHHTYVLLDAGPSSDVILATHQITTDSRMIKDGLATKFTQWLTSTGVITLDRAGLPIKASLTTVLEAKMSECKAGVVENAVITTTTTYRLDPK